MIDTCNLITATLGEGALVQDMVYFSPPFGLHGFFVKSAYIFNKI